MEIPSELDHTAFVAWIPEYAAKWVALSETKGENLEFCSACSVAISTVTKQRGMRCVYCRHR